jgi:hypothetical protein
MFTGDASYSVAYLRLGSRRAADAALDLAFTHIEPTFQVIVQCHSHNAAMEGRWAVSLMLSGLDRSSWKSRGKGTRARSIF